MALRHMECKQLLVFACSCRAVHPSLYHIWEPHAVLCVKLNIYYYLLFNIPHHCIFLGNFI